MEAKKSLLSLATTVVLMMLAIMTFNFYVDPYCYYCDDINSKKYTLNRFYQVAQLIQISPETEQIILGSSRGETTSAKMIEQKTGLKTLNLSKAGSELTAKKVFLALTAEKTKLKKVIWLADYFEFIGSSADPILINTPSLVQYANETASQKSIISGLIQLQKLFDHTTTEASFFAMKKFGTFDLGQGEGSSINFEECERNSYLGILSSEKLQQEVDLLYEFYVHGPIAPAQSSTAFKSFKTWIQNYSAKGIEFVIVIPPYHPVFMSRLRTEQPQIYSEHIRWIKNLSELELPSVRVVSYFEGIPGDDGSPAYWNDGVHFGCKGAQRMLGPLLINPK